MKLGRALGGLGAAAVTLSGKYIDDEILQQRQQAFLDMQHAQRVKTESWEQSEDVQGRRLSNELTRAKRVAQANLDAEINRESNPSLRQAKIDARIAELDQLTPAQVRAANELEAGTAGTKLDSERMRRMVVDPLDVAKAGAIADEQYGAQAKHSDRLKSAFDRLPEAVKLQVQQTAAELKTINDAVTKAKADGMWDPAKNPAQAELVADQAGLRKRLDTMLKGSEGDALGLFADPPKTAAGAEKTELDPAKSKGAKKEPAAPKAEASRDPMEEASDATLERIAAIQGHANQKRAKEILERRAMERGFTSTPSTAAGSLNFFP